MAPQRPATRSPWAAGLVVGVLADRVLGDPPRFHPVAGFGRLGDWLERAAWRPTRRTGAWYVAALVAVPALAAGALDRMLAGRPVPRAAFIATVTWAAVGGRSLERVGARVGTLIAAADLTGARAQLPALVGRDPSTLEPPEVCRAAIESVAENTADAVAGPIFWGAVAGPAGVVAYRAANTLDAMVGHRDPRHKRFGWAAARLDDVLTWPVARISALAAVALAPMVDGDTREAWRTMRRDGGRHPSPNAGRLEAAFAGALGVRLGGTNRYPSGTERRPDLGDGRPPEPVDVLRATRLARATGLVCAALLAGVALARPWR